MCIYTVTLHSRYQRVRPFVNSISMERKRQIFCVCCCCLRPNALVRQHPSAATKTSLINSCVNHKPILLSRESLLRRNSRLAILINARATCADVEANCFPNCYQYLDPGCDSWHLSKSGFVPLERKRVRWTSILPRLAD